MNNNTNLYNEYIKWFKCHFNFNPNDVEYNSIDPIDEMIEIRKDVEIFLASKRKTHETKMMQERLNHLEIITFKEYKNSLIYFRRILFERYKYV